MKNKKIVVVEDEETLLDALTTALEDEGCEVVTVMKGNLATKVISTEKPDLVLLDIILPQKDGFAILEKLKKKKSTASIPVIILTNLSQEDDKDRGLELGAVDYFVKSSMELGKLIEKIEEILG